MSITLRNKKLIFLFLVLSQLFAFSQQTYNVDSMLAIVNNPSAPDSSVSNAYLFLTKATMLENPKKGLNYINKSISVFKRFSKVFPSRRYHTKATILKNIGQTDSALFYCNAVLNNAIKVKDEDFIAAMYQEFGNICISQGNFRKAIEYFNKEMEVIKRNKKYNLVSGSYNNMGIAHANLGEWDMAREFFTRATKHDISINNENALGNDYNNLGVVYMVNKQTDSAYKYIEKGLSYRRKFKDAMGIGGSFNNLAILQSNKGNFVKAIQLADSALYIAQSNSFKKLEYEIYSTYDNIYASKGDFEKAHLYLLKVHKMREQSAKEETSTKIQQLEDDIKSEQNQAKLLEKDLQLTKSENQKQKQTGIIFIGALVLLALMIFLYTFFKNNRRLKDSNKIISSQKHLIEEKHKDITDSINYAQKIQSALIISEENLNKSLKEAFVIFKPRDIVSGDFYWFTEHKGVKIVAMADCTGHGVPGAFMSMIGMTLLNKIVNEKNITSPAKILNNLREDVIKSLNLNSASNEKSDGMDMSVIAIANNQLFYAGANSYAYLLEGNNLIELKPNKQPIGVHIRNEEYVEQKMDIKPGAKIYLFSDGITDQFGGESGKKVKSKQFKDWLVATSSLTLREQKLAIESNLNNWKSGFEQTDDISVIGIKLN